MGDSEYWTGLQGWDWQMILPNHILKLMSPADRAKLGAGGMTAEEALAQFEARTEKQLQSQLESMLALNGIVAIRQRMDRKSNVAIGTPDILFAVNGTPAAWEVKLPGKNPTVEQIEMMKRMAANGWRCRVIRSYDEGLNCLRGIRANIRRGDE